MNRMDGNACTMTGFKSDEWLCSKGLEIKKKR